MALLDTPNESFSNDASVIETGGVVFVDSDQNTITNSGVLWGTGSTADAIICGITSSNTTITNTVTGYIRGGKSALALVGSGAMIDNAGEIIGGRDGVVIAGASGAQINNAGEIIGGEDAIALGLASGVKLNNDFRGTIEGGNLGINFNVGDDTSEINNDGFIYGGNAGVTLHRGTLTNSGEIGGEIAGVFSLSATIVNKDSGLIRSSGTAVEVFDLTAIANNAGAQISGTQAAIKTANSGQISLTNHGKIDGVINCDATTGNVNDVVINKGTITDRVELGAGNDVFDGGGGNSHEVYGEAGNDTLFGGADSTALDGGVGRDILSGGRGRDELVGGADRDLFDFDSIKDSVRGGKRDVIGDFQRGQDHIDLRDIDAKTGSGNQAFKFIGKQDFHDQKGELRYEDKGNKVIVQGDVNGDGKADFEIFVKVGALSAGDFLL